MAEKIAKMRTEVHSFISTFKEFSQSALKIVTSENIIQAKSSDIASLSTRGDIDIIPSSDISAAISKSESVTRIVEVGITNLQQITMMTSDISAVFDRYDKFVDFAAKVSAKVDKTRLDEFSDATVLNNKLEVVKKKIEGFDVQIEKDYKTMMSQAYALYVRLLQEYSDFFNRH